jgi:hypothetical protein
MPKKRQIIQIAVAGTKEDDPTIVALADDGTVWRTAVQHVFNRGAGGVQTAKEFGWHQLPALPQ